MPGGPPGIAALQVVTLRRCAEIVSGGELSAEGRRPLTGPVLIGALRSALAAEAGVFAPVAGNIGTARALARAYRALRPLPQSTWTALAAHGRVIAETVRLCRALHERLIFQWFDEVDLLETATR
jgi:hypothetical protein